MVMDRASEHGVYQKLLVPKQSIATVSSLEVSAPDSNAVIKNEVDDLVTL